MFRRFWSIFSSDIAIDLGTANILVLNKNQEILTNEPSIVAMHRNHKGKDEILAVGSKAKEMLGKTPDSIRAIRPLKDGVIADFETTELMMRYFIEKVHNRKSFLSPRMVICVPYEVTRVERRAIEDAAYNAGARFVYLIEEPMAAAIGAGLNVEVAQGNLVVDIGGGTTEIGITSLGGIVASTSLRVGGNKLDQDIIDYIKKNFNLHIGERTAENLKIELGTAINSSKVQKKTVSGRDTTNGTVVSIEVTSQDIRKAIENSLEDLAHALENIIGKCPPELAGDIIDNGIVLTGGGALIGDLDTYLSDITKVNVRIAQDPLLCVAKGSAKVLQQIDMLQKIAKQDRH